MRLTDVDRLRDEVLKWLPSDPCGVEEKEFPYETDIVVSMMLTLEEAPIIDICFCEECIYADGKPIADGRYWCNIHRCYMSFCSDGERRTDG